MMLKGITLCLTLISATIMSPYTARAAITNAGFETGTTNGWMITSSAPSSVTVNSNGASTGNYGLVLWSTAAYDSNVSQAMNGLANGQYTLSAMMKNSGGQAIAYLYAKGCGGTDKMTSLPVSANATRVVVRGIQVTGGRCTIGVYSSASANQWLSMDDVSFTQSTAPLYNFLKGGDISRLTYIESLGARFYDRGVQKDAVQILADNGFNFVRLRAYNDPGNPCCSPSNKMPAGFESTADILALAKRAGNYKMQVQLSLNYSDWWADGCTQDVPHEWSSMTFAQIKTAMYNYTYDIVKRLNDQGTPPSMVSLGNQMQCGILLNPGNHGTYSNMPQLAQLLNAGAQAVKAASPSSKVMLHIDSPYNAQWFFDGVVNGGVSFDVIGVSWYPYWESYAKHDSTDTLPELVASLNTIASRYKKDIVIMETGVNWSPKLSNGYVGQLETNGNVPYASTPEGQRDYMYDIMNSCKLVDDGRCVGIQYWDPIAVNQAGFGWIVGGPNSNDNATLFDWNHNSIPALTQAFKQNR